MPEAVGAKPAYLTIFASVAQLAEVTGLDPAHVQVQLLPEAPIRRRGAMEQRRRLLNARLEVRILAAAPLRSSF